jgi:hypothetical protein
MRKFSIALIPFYLGNMKRRQLRIFLLRGGLGNQLFQIAGMANLSKNNNYDVVFCETDVKKNPRDKQGAAALDFNVEAWFGEQISVYRSSRIVDLFIRLIRNRKVWKFSLQTINVDLALVDSDVAIATMQGYLQSPQYPRAIPTKILMETFKQREVQSINSDLLAIHIRARDGLQFSAMALSLNHYRAGLMHVGAGPESKIDVFSDDVSYAKSFCDQLGNFNFNFPEIALELSPTELLLKLASYNKIISSKSTLCWWSAYIAQTRNPSAMIISPWESDLHLESWVRLKNA